MLKTIIGLLILFWVLGIIFRIAGALIHLLLVIAAVIIIMKLISGKKRKNY